LLLTVRLYNITGSYYTFNAGFTLSSPGLVAALPTGVNCSSANVIQYNTPRTGSICPTFNKTKVTPTTTSSSIKFNMMPFNNWFYQKMTIYGNVLTLAVCLTNCYVVLPGSPAQLVGPNYVQYGALSPSGHYDCNAVNCFTINCCTNSVTALAVNPCSPDIGGTVSCVTQVVTFNETLSNWTSVDPTQSYYCDVDTGACFPSIDISYSWTPLSWILLAIGSVLLVALIAFIVLLGSRLRSNMNMM